MITEKCSCCNMVAGVFTPSDTRRYLTSLAKKGGMKAVLAALGSVVPGLGNIGGLFVGTLIDLKYGKDVEKLIDKAADIFEDKKVYVFNCPNCGKSWASSIVVDNDKYEEEYDFVEDLLDDSKEEYLTHDVSMQLQEMESIFDEAQKYDVLSEEFCRNASIALNMAEEEYVKLDEVYDAEYDSEVRDVLKNQLEKFFKNILNYIAHACQGKMNSPVACEKSALMLPFSMEVHGVYPCDLDNEKKTMVVGIILAGSIHPGDNIRLEHDEEVSVEAVLMFGKRLEVGEAGDVCAVIVPSYHVDEDDEEVYYEFPQVIQGFKDSSIEASEDINDMTESEEEYMSEYTACFEGGTTISDKERRLLNRLRDSLGISLERGMELEAQCLMSILSDEEKEYVAEVKACLADGGSISDRERRLLTRIAKSLGISEERARELETTI